MVALGGCMVALGGCTWLLGVCAWLLRGACVVAWGGMHGCSGGACVVARGGVWLLQGACMVFSGGGACMVFAGGMHGFFWGDAWFFRGGMHGFSGGGVHRIRRDTVNERAVRILLECILVLLYPFEEMSVSQSFSFRCEQSLTLCRACSASGIRSTAPSSACTTYSPGNSTLQKTFAY